MPADAGGMSRRFSIAFGPARLHSALASNQHHTMSIEANYRRVTPLEFARLQSDTKAAEAFFGTSLEDLDDPE